MTAWTEYSEADFDARRAPRKAARRAAEAAEAGQGALFFAPMPVAPVKSAPAAEPELPGQEAMFGPNPGEEPGQAAGEDREDTTSRYAREHQAAWDALPEDEKRCRYDAMVRAGSGMAAGALGILP